MLLATYFVTNTNDSGEGSLRLALNSANAAGQPATIDFHIQGTGPQTIEVGVGSGAALPTIRVPTFIDGFSEGVFQGNPNYSGPPLVVIDGAQTPGKNGFDLNAGSSGSVIQGLAITNFKLVIGKGFNGGEAIVIEPTSNGNVIEGNYIGIAADGRTAEPNDVAGVFVSSFGNKIGGTTAAARNVISGNEQGGVVIVLPGRNNVVEGNYIGTDATGTRAVPNGYGVVLGGALLTRLGGTSASAANVISGNTFDGVLLSGDGFGFVPSEPTSGNMIEGNFIGTDPTGETAVPNGGLGVDAIDADHTTVGGLTPVPGTAPGNLISGNGEPGIGIFSARATANVVLGNLIGTDTTGTRSLGNANIGVLVANASGNTIGSPIPGARNVISGNVAVGSPAPPTVPPELTGAGGIVIIGSSSVGNVVQGNFIGTDQGGSIALGNAFDGISLSGAPRNTVGGTTAGAGNLISGNTMVGIRIVGPEAVGNLVQGNFVGTNAAGSAALGNGSDGVFLNGSPSNSIGGTATPARNVISGNGGNGIQAFGTGASGNLVQGNFIGTDATGALALGNQFDGVFLNGAPNNTIGGSDTGAGNVIAQNGFGRANVITLGSGVDIFGRGARGNVVQGNFIGTGAGGNGALGNATYGVLIQNATSNTIGGIALGAGNVVANNPFGGIEILVNGLPVVIPDTAGNLVRGNQLSGNGLRPFDPGSPVSPGGSSSPLKLHFAGRGHMSIPAGAHRLFPARNGRLRLSRGRA